MLIGSAIRRLLRAKHEATPDERAGKEIQPQKKTGEAQYADNKRGQQTGGRTELHKNKDHRSKKTKKPERSEDEARQEDFRSNQQETDEKKRDDDGRSVGHGQLPDGRAGRPMKKALMLSPTLTAVLVVVSQVFSPQRLACPTNPPPSTQRSPKEPPLEAGAVFGAESVALAGPVAATGVRRRDTTLPSFAETSTLPTSAPAVSKS